MTGCRSRDTCRDLSKIKNSTSLLTMYTVNTLFVVDNKNKFKSNSDVYHINTRKNVTWPTVIKFITISKRIHTDTYMASIQHLSINRWNGIKVVNILLQSMENLSDNA
jgi:hypothetical protein